MSFRDDINQFTDALGIAIKEVSSQRAMKEYGKMAVKLIRARTRRGFGVIKTGANATRLARLAESTVEKRKRFPGLSSQTTPGKSNLTFTGQLLDSLRVKSVTNQTVIIGADRRRRKGGLTNEELSGIQQTRGRNRPARVFLNLSTNELKALTREFSFSFSKALKKSL